MKKETVRLVAGSLLVAGSVILSQSTQEDVQGSSLGSGQDLRASLIEMNQGDHETLTAGWGWFSGSSDGDKSGDEGKCGEGSCGAKSGSEGKCGEGMCGGDMKDRADEMKDKAHEMKDSMEKEMKGMKDKMGY